MKRKGLGAGTGKGYKNIIGQDPKVHSDSSRGMKQTVPMKPLPEIRRPIQDSELMVGDLVKTQGMVVPYEGEITRFDGMHAIVRQGNLEYRLPLNSLVKQERLQTNVRDKYTVRTKKMSLPSEMRDKFTPEEIKALKMLNYQYQEGIWSLKWTKNPSELFFLGIQLGIPKTQARKLAIKYLDTLEKYPYEEGLKFMGYEV